MMFCFLSKVRHPKLFPLIHAANPKGPTVFNQLENNDVLFFALCLSFKKEIEHVYELQSRILEKQPYPRLVMLFRYSTSHCLQFTSDNL